MEKAKNDKCDIATDGIQDAVMVYVEEQTRSINGAPTEGTVARTISREVGCLETEVLGILGAMEDAGKIRRGSPDAGWNNSKVRLV